MRTENLPDLNVLTSEEFQQAQADALEQEQKEPAQKTGNLIAVFVQSYEQHKSTMPLDQWLVAEFKHYPEIWRDEADLTDTAKEIIETITRNNAAKESLYAHIEQGKSESSWIAKQFEQGAKAAGMVNVGQYAGQIESAIERANADMANTITRIDGCISQARNLDGFLAEQHHVDTFNLEATAKGSSFRAKALVPDGTGYGKNSMDIGIYDANGKLVRRYQAKYGQDADATHVLWKKGDYRGQQKLVPADQVKDVPNATDRIEHDGVSSLPLTKGEAKALQEKAQLHEESKTYEWNDVSRGEIAKKIGKQALVAASLVAAFHGVRVFGRRTWNSLMNKKNPPLSEDLKDFFESSLKGSAQVGVQVAVSGAVVVAAKNGLLGAVLKNTPAKHIVSMAYLAMENAKVLYKLANKELTGVEAIDAMGKTSTSLLISMAAATEGAAIGGGIGLVFGPVGAFVGGFIGGVVAGMAGSQIGEKLYEDSKKIVRTAVTIVENVASEVASGIKSVARALNSSN